jgi:hypothetical protein
MAAISALGWPSAPEFSPPQAVCAVRSVLRHRENLVQISSKHVLHLQKALTQMNVQIHNVITDITGLTGLRIILSRSLAFSLGKNAAKGWAFIVIQKRKQFRIWGLKG